MLEKETQEGPHTATSRKSEKSFRTCRTFHVGGYIQNVYRAIIPENQSQEFQIFTSPLFFAFMSLYQEPLTRLYHQLKFNSPTASREKSTSSRIFQLKVINNNCKLVREFVSIKLIFLIKFTYFI